MTVSWNDKAAIFAEAGYHPSAVQMDVHRSEARHRIVAAGARGGKSMLAGYELACLMLVPNALAWCCSSQYSLAEKEFDWCVRACDRIRFQGRRLIEHARASVSARGSKRLEFPWGSVLETKSTEKPQTLLGVELDMLVLGEASQIRRSVWDRYLSMRLVSRKGQLLAVSTPNADGNLFHDFYRRGESGSDPEWASWSFESRANPTFPKGEWERMERDMDAKVFAEQARGLFVSRRGHVFSLVPACVAPIEPRPEDPFMAGIWYRPNNRFVAAAVHVLPGTPRRYHVSGEICRDGAATLKECLPAVRELVRGRPRFLGCVADHWDRALLAELKAEGMPCVTNRVEAKVGQKAALQKRVQGLMNLLRERDDGPPRLRIDPRAASVLKDFESAKWPDPKEDGSDRLESDVPLDRSMPGPHAVSHVCAFLEEGAGADFYGAGGKD